MAGYSCAQVCVRLLSSNQDHPITIADDDSALASEIERPDKGVSRVGIALNES